MKPSVSVRCSVIIETLAFKQLGTFFVKKKKIWEVN